MPVLPILVYRFLQVPFHSYDDGEDNDDGDDDDMMQPLPAIK